MNLTSNFFKKLPNVLTNSKLFRPMSSSVDNQVLLETFNNNKGVITLNRPKALNSVNVPMINKLQATLKSWENEKSLVIIKGAGDKALSAGGDVKGIGEAWIKGDQQMGKNIFREMYFIYLLVNTYKIPYIALMNGVAMGAGVGLSVNGRYSVATEKTVMAMPEAQIGLFPDAGSSYFLSRLEGKLGLYLGMTSSRLIGPDLSKVGLATHYCDSTNLQKLEKELLNCDDDTAVKKVLNKFSAKDEKEFSLAPHMAQINKCFGEDSVEKIIKALEQDGSDWAKKTVKTLNRISPTSLKIIMKQLELGKNLTFSECIQMEYIIACHCLSNRNFYEGVRALLIEKDMKPVWNPAKLSEVTPEMVESYFTTSSPDQELKHKL